MDGSHWIIFWRLTAAVVAGGLIGLERSYHGRPAGFRTHTLVCLASAALMLVTVYERQWMSSVTLETVRMDPTRMAQGIMTGIGFLGAGVIFKEGISVRGLTTAASIWITAATGILIGIGFWSAATLTAVFTLFVLAAFRWIESRIPAESYARFEVRYPRESSTDEESLRMLLARFGFSMANPNFRLTDGGRTMEYRMVIRTPTPRNFARLAAHLMSDPLIREFQISPTGD